MVVSTGTYCSLARPMFSSLDILYYSSKNRAVAGNTNIALNA